MTATILLIRHAAHADLGRTLSGRSPCRGLTPEGEAQAHALARRLAGTRLATIYTSPVRRARQTAGVLAEALRTDIEIAPALEEIDFGAWTGRAYAELADEPGWTAWNTHRSIARAADGEAMADAQARIVRFLDGAADTHAGAAFACVSHCDMIRAARSVVPPAVTATRTRTGRLG